MNNNKTLQKRNKYSNPNKYSKPNKIKKTLKTNIKGGTRIINKNESEPDFKINEVFGHKQYLKKIDITDKSLLWGLGIEHEMQIFHQGKNVSSDNFENANIIFDSQESTCFISGDDHPQGACCKKVPGYCYYHQGKIRNKEIKKKLNNKRNKLTADEKEFLLALDWELTGRQAKGCIKDSTIVARTPVLMPELVTGKFRNRTINSIVNESILQEETYLKCQMKNPFTREKVKQYGPLVTHLCGTLDNIKVPKRPTIYNKNYEFETVEYKDYVGSYHVTLTLPHNKDITKKEFVELHRDCANQLQWLEPLIVAAFFSPDPESVGDGLDKLKGSQGSFRVMSVGWGNLAGSDVRKFGSEGIGRGTNQVIKWRRGLKFKGTERLDECVKSAKPQYKKAVSILTSDFRTFNFEPDYDKCKRLYTPYDCPKIDGGIMEPPFGMEIRIFDHFPSSYLLDLMKIIALVANNCDRHPPRKYVYSNKAWIEGIRGIMKEGWNYKIKQDYLKELRTQLGLKININEKPWNGNMTSTEVFKCIISELHELNKDGIIVSLMDETPEVAPKIPAINRMCYELSFNQKFFKLVMRQLRNAKLAHINEGRKTVSTMRFKKMLFGKIGDKVSLLKRGAWQHQFDDLCYALESKGKVELIMDKGNIKKVKLMF